MIAKCYHKNLGELCNSRVKLRYVYYIIGKQLCTQSVYIKDLCVNKYKNKQNDRSTAPVSNKRSIYPKLHTIQVKR